PLATGRAPAKPAPPPKKTVTVAKVAPPPPAKEVGVAKPAPPAVAVAKATANARGVWRVQLGAFSGRGAAEGLYRKLSSNSALAGRQAFYIPVSKITRLQAGPF